MTNIFKRYYENLPEEQKERIKKMTELENEHTYYKTETNLDIDEEVKGEVIEGSKNVTQEVKVYRDVYGDFTLGDKVLISFGGYREYAFDKNFIEKCMTVPDKRLCIDAGAKTYVNGGELLRIREESLKALESKGIDVENDYFGEFRESGIGKMVDGMELL